MPKRRIVFIRHGETLKDREVHAAFWQLTDAGKKAAAELASLDCMQGVTTAYTSTESKAIVTALPVITTYSVPLIQMAEFDEIKRSSRFLSDEEFAAEKRRQLSDWSYVSENGESSQHALDRFESGIAHVLAKHESGTIVIVSHGTVLALYFAHLQNITSGIFERWEATDFCAYGIVEDGVVTKDIVAK